MSNYLTAVIADAPLHYWRFADPGGSLGADVGSARSHMHGVAGPYVLGYSGPISDGGSIDLALSGAYANTGRVIHFPGGACSIEMLVWVWQAIGSPAYHCQWNNAPELSLQRNGTDWGFVYNGVRANNANGYTSQAWHHLVGTYDGANARLYVDSTVGAAAAVAAAPAFDQVFELSSSLAVGTYGTAFYSEVAIYGAALSGGRVNAHYAAIDNGLQQPVFSGASGLTGASGTDSAYLGILQRILQSVRGVY